MWVRNTAPGTYRTERLKDPDGTLGEVVEFTDGWTANVPEDVGEAMVEHYDHIEPTDNESENTEE